MALNKVHHYKKVYRYKIKKMIILKLCLKLMNKMRFLNL